MTRKINSTAATPKTSLATYAWKVEHPTHPIFSLTWFINAPWAHPLWHQYVLVLYDLVTPTVEAPKLHLKDATHEMMLYALDPEHPIAKGSVPTTESLHRLSPPNYAYQFKAASNAAAEERLQAVVDGIVAREINPDTDFRSLWDNGLFPDAYPLVTSGFWGV